ncbi:MAG: hypothetical protein OSJ72_15110 [Lachnospiraceae bacterium]|nr:hypothetical protein [Lachnospiraceae bacterium]
MEVSESVKQAYQGTGVTKYITLTFPELNISMMTGDGHIHSESMHLSEGLVNSDGIEFVGCIASKFKIQVNNLTADVKGKRLVVKIHTEGTEDEPVPLFNGIVDSAIKQSNKRVKEITAYDELYTSGNIDVASWYKSLIFPITLKNLRDSLFGYIGLEQTETDLPNDGVSIKKQYAPNSLQALSIIKAICQINGVFGIVNREGKFEYRTLGAIDDGLYPGFYPGPDAFPGVSLGALGLDDIDPTDFSFYKKVDYEEFKVKPVDMLTIRQSEDDQGVTYGSGINNYIIQGNPFTYGLSKDVLMQIAENIYPNVQGFSYIPFQSENNGLPYLECGVDAAAYMMIDFETTEENGEIAYNRQNFYILNRELSGIQALKDSYSAKGEEYQSEFITDLRTQIDLIKKNQGASKQDLENYYDKDAIDDMFASFEGGGGSKIISVAQLPTDIINPDAYYAIQGIVVVE